jgi:hypothetical protein
MQKFDDAETYFLNFTSDLPNEAGGIPIALYLLCAADAGLVPEALKAELDARRARGQYPSEMLFDLADGKLTTDELTEEGAEFTRAYYASDYLDDYASCFGLSAATVDALCAIPDSLWSMAKLKPGFNARLATWRAQPRKEAPPRPLTTGEVFTLLQRELLPLLRADGYEDMAPRLNEFEVRRRRGPIEQQLLLMVLESNGVVWVTFGAYIGAERLRRVWLQLARRQDDPPPAFAVPVRHRPDVQADEFSLTARDDGFSSYFQRIPDAPDRAVRIAIVHYLEAVRPRLDALDSIVELARQVQFPGQRRRLTHKLGFMKGPELLARIVLLAVYTNEFHGSDEKELLKLLHQQVRFDNARARDEFPDDDDVDQLIAALKVPGVREKVREYLDRPA